jgi:hypothetical protein
MTIEARANRESRNTRGLFAWLAAALVLTASFTANDGAAVVSASFASAASSTFPPVTGDSIDPLFTQPYVDIDEWRDAPVRHRHVHGGFKGTETRFSMYFPTKEQYQGRFFQPLTARAGVDDTSQRGSGSNTPIGFAVASGAYLVDSNQGQTLETPANKAVETWRANAAVAKYSRKLAVDMYGPGRVYGYLYGGSGGAYKTFGCVENTIGVWDGSIPYIHGSPMSLPYGYTVKGHALRILKNKWPAIIDAVEPGGSGDMYAALNQEQRDALLEITRHGFPPRAWFFNERLGMGPIAGSIFDDVQKSDPTYFDDFWKTPGYLGADHPEVFARDRIQQHKTTVTSVKLDLSGAGATGTISFADPPTKGDVIGATVMVKSGAASGHVLYITNVVDNVFRVGFNQETFQAIRAVKMGDEVTIDNSAYLAAQTYHRHHVPSPDFHAWDQYRGPDGKPLYPQRPVPLLGPRLVSQSSGATQSGRFAGKMIVVNMLVDQMARPWSADWYRSKVKSVLGARIDDYYRLWYVDNALHGQPVELTDNIRVINYTGILQQALRDLSAWVEKGVPPPPTTNYRMVDNQVQLPPTAAERRGIQPVVTLTANGSARAEVAVGQPVRFAGIIERPPNTGVIVSAEWDFEGRGDYPIAETLNAGFNDWRGPEATEPRVTVETTYAFSTPGTYFPALRAASQRQGDATTPYARAMNLGRVRVVVK